MEAALVGMWSSGNRLVIRVSCFWSRHVNHLPIISVAPCAESSHCSKHSNRRVLVCSAGCYYGVFHFFVLFFVLEALKSDCEFFWKLALLKNQVNLQKLWGTACVLLPWGYIAVLTLLCVITRVKYKWQHDSDWHSCHFHTHIVSTLCNAHAPAVPPLTCWSDMEVWSGALLPYCYIQGEESAAMSNQNWSEVNRTVHYGAAFL